MIVILVGTISDYEKDLANKIFSKMNVKLFNISFGILRSQHDAEEAVAQTFLNIMKYIEKISALPCPEIEPYCVIILKNETMNIIRKRKKIVHLEDVDYVLHNDNGYDIKEEYMKKVDKEELLNHINKLSDEERYLIYLRFVYEMTYRQISEIMDITEQAARKRGYRILEKLRLCYEEGDKGV